MKGWRTNIGGAVGALATTLQGVGVLGYVSNGAHPSLMWWIALVGFILSAVAKFLSTLFVADAADVVELQARTAIAIATGDPAALVNEKSASDKAGADCSQYSP